MIFFLPSPVSLQLVPKSLLASQQGCVNIFLSYATSMPVCPPNQGVKFLQVTFPKQWPIDPIFTG